MTNIEEIFVSPNKPTIYNTPNQVFKIIPMSEDEDEGSGDEDKPIIPLSQTIRFGTTETFTAGSDAAGFNPVTISATAPALEPKSITITSNGSSTVTPSQNYDGISQVNITTAVPPTVPNLQTKNLTITENTITNITADTGYDGLQQVNITTSVPQNNPNLQSKSINITQNGTLTTYPDFGFDGLSSLTTNTTVSAQPNLQSKSETIQTNNTTTTYTPDSGYDGLSSISITTDIPSSSNIVPLIQTVPCGTTQTFNVSQNEDGFNPVTITGGLPNLQNKSVTITKPGTTTIQADQGYDGLNNITITTTADALSTNGAIEFISSKSINNESILYFDNVLSLNYRQIVIKIKNLIANENTARILVRLYNYDSQNNIRTVCDTASAYYSNMDDFLGSTIRSNSSLGTYAGFKIGNDNSNYRYTAGPNNLIVTFNTPVNGMESISGNCLMDYYRNSSGTWTASWTRGNFTFKVNQFQSLVNSLYIYTEGENVMFTSGDISVYGLI